MSKGADDYLAFLTANMVQEGAVVIRPHSEPFRAKERSFLDGIRTTPSAISAPAGTNPYTAVTRRPGHWVFIWLPD